MCAPRLFASLVLLAILSSPLLVHAADEESSDKLLPTVSLLAPDGIYHLENSGSVHLQIVLGSLPPEGKVSGVSWEAVSGSAESGVDFVAASGQETWTDSDTDLTRDIYIQINDDSDNEGSGETFTVSIDPFSTINVWLRDPWTHLIEILDDDSGVNHEPQAYLNLSSPFGVGTALPWDLSFDVPVRLSVPATGPYSVFYTLDPDPTIHELVFDGTVEEIITVPALSTAPATPFVSRYLNLLTSQSKKKSSQWHFLTLAIRSVFRDTRPDLSVCGVCWWEALKKAWNYNHDCEAACAATGEECASPSDGASKQGLGPSDLLRQYRDDILLPTESGQNLVWLYRQHSQDAALAMVMDPYLIDQIEQTMTAWIPAFEAVMTDGGGSYTLNIFHQRLLSDTLDMFLEAGRPEFVSFLQDMRTRLDLDNVDGLTMEEFQQRIDSATVQTQETSWGALKASFDQ